MLPPLQAQEILKSSRGALMWHGRDLRHFKRILSPPLQQLLTQPGTAVLGRGLASMPAAAAHQMGAAKVGAKAAGGWLPIAGCVMSGSLSALSSSKFMCCLPCDPTTCRR
jgi:hypothetical protein